MRIFLLESAHGQIPQLIGQRSWNLSMLHVHCKLGFVLKSVHVTSFCCPALKTFVSSIEYAQGQIPHVFGHIAAMSLLLLHAHLYLVNSRSLQVRSSFNNVNVVSSSSQEHFSFPQVVGQRSIAIFLLHFHPFPGKFMLRQVVDMPSTSNSPSVSIQPLVGRTVGTGVGAFVGALVFLHPEIFPCSSFATPTRLKEPYPSPTKRSNEEEL
mmetsp:Transcript_429/g.680  ORF Transcript_429/g.680 Transcript_429/m.680 type:complete len:210 (+) Transcript_429:641-1270(+)